MLYRAWWQDCFRVRLLTYKRFLSLSKWEKNSYLDFMNNPLISIIIPAYNVEQYLTACLSSIEQQTYQNFEAILIDDGSKDSTGDICDAIAAKDNRFKVIHQKNQGVSAARNVGIGEANGEYICFVDSDDKLLKDFLKGFGLNYDISIQGYLLQEGEKKSQISYREFLSFDNIAKVYCLNDIHNAPFSKLCRTEIIKKNNIRFPDGISFSEDTIFFLQYIKYCKSIHISNKYNYVYNKREDSLTAKHHDIGMLMKKEDLLFSLYDELFLDRSFKKKFFHELSLFVVSKYYFCENIKTIQSLYLKDICKKYLSSCEKILLRMSYPLFCFYALWRRRFKRRVLRVLFHHYDTTLLNI